PARRIMIDVYAHRGEQLVATGVVQELRRQTLVTRREAADDRPCVSARRAPALVSRRARTCMHVDLRHGRGVGARPVPACGAAHTSCDRAARRTRYAEPASP